MKKRLNLPNSITIFRILLVIPITILLIKDQYLWAVLVFLLAAISDVADGFLARKLNMQTKIGAILDPLADKILINYTFVILTTKGYIPLLLFGVVLIKDIILAVGSSVEVLSVKSISNLKIKASFAGKISTFFQILVIVFVFLKLFDVYKNETIFEILIYTTITLSIFALFSYIHDYQKRNREVF